MGKFFGTDGVRGVANYELTCELATKIGKAMVNILKAQYSHKLKILIGKDTRISSDMLESALLSGICSCGADGISLGVVPTPAVAYLVKKYKADAGIMISASHNSYEFNGIKIFNKNGYKLSDELENKIEEMIVNNQFELAKSEEIGTVTQLETAVDDYIEYLSNVAKTDISNLKIAVDCANGSASVTAEKLFKKLGLSTHIICQTPNGTNINEKCGSTYIDNISDFVVNNGYDLGIALDGDADRCLAVDETGKLIDGDMILAICAKYLKENNELKNNAVVGTIMANAGLEKFCKKNDMIYEETKVGDRYVLERLLEKNYSIGAEQSGHVIFLDHSTTGDGQLTAIKLLEVISNSGKKVSELIDEFEKFPQILSQIVITPDLRGAISKSEKISNYIKNLKEQFAQNGKIVIRESGTEPKIRVMVEHEDETKLQELSNSIVNTLRQMLAEYKSEDN